jgi:hypothetical protein
MGGKRSDQVYSDPREMGTDKKTRTDDQHIHAEDKQHLHEERGKLAKKTENDVDEMSEDSFPASDPPSTTPTSIGSKKADGK